METKENKCRRDMLAVKNLRPAMRHLFQVNHLLKVEQSFAAFTHFIFKGLFPLHHSHLQASTMACIYNVDGIAFMHK